MSTGNLDSGTERAARPTLFWGLLLIALVFGAGLRLYGLNEGSLWIDELYTVRDACDIFEGGRPTRWTGYIPTGLVLYATDMDAPNITWDNLNTWRAKGLEPWHIRLAPALIGIFSIPLLALSIRKSLRDDAVAGVFAVLLAFAPWHLFWSQLGRYYTLKFLFLGLAFSWYYRATRQGEKKYVIWACVALYATFLVHPVALSMGVIFLLDIALSYLRKQPIRIGKTGWIAAVSTAALAGLTLLIETKVFGNAYAPFVGEATMVGQSPILVVAGAFFMIQMPVLLCAGAAVIAFKKRGDRLQVGMYWLLVGMVPILIMAAASLKTFSQARYAFDSLLGFLVLASFAVVFAWRALEPKYGRLFAALPCMLILAGNAMLIAQHHTTGKHLHRDWVSAYDYVLEHREPGEKVIAQRQEIATYYMGEPVTVHPPGVRYIADRYAEGRPVWVVDLGSSSTHDYRWKFADYAELRGVYPIRIWQPYSEIHVFRYTPRPREVWEAEVLEAEARADAIE